MVNTQLVFERLDLGTSRFAAVQAVQAAIETAEQPQEKAQDLIFQIIGIKVVYDNADKARLVAKAVADEAWKANHQISNEEEILKICEVRIDKFMAAEPWHFAKPQVYQAVATEQKQVSELVETKVEVKTNGSMKKGGKEVLARELYKKFVLEVKPEDALDNQGFIKLLIKELDMSKAGATTYAYNCKKALGEPVGGMKKSKKGRKATRSNCQ